MHLHLTRGTRVLLVEILRDSRSCLLALPLLRKHQRLNSEQTVQFQRARGSVVLLRLATRAKTELEDFAL